jgi:hypothetical protein
MYISVPLEANWGPILIAPTGSRQVKADSAIYSVVSYKKRVFCSFEAKIKDVVL